MTTKLEKLLAFILIFFLFLAGFASPVPIPGSYGYNQTVVAHATDEESPSCTLKAKPPSSDKLLEWKSFESNQYGFEFRYPPDGEVQTYSSKERKIVKVDLPVPSGSLLQEKFLVVKVGRDLKRCINGLSDTEPRKTVYINDRKFVKEEFEEGATGDIYGHTVYSTKQGNICFILDFVLHSTNPEIYESPPPDFNRSEAEVFRKILGTFRFIRLN